MHPHLQTLIQCIDLEEKEQVFRFRLDQEHNIKTLKAEGLALHPINVVRKYFGYADYPEISFRLPFPAETGLFRDNSAIECFYMGEDVLKGVLINLDGNTGEFRIFAPDFPEWIEEKGVGIKLAPDTHTTGIMKKVLQDLENNKPLFRLFQQIHGDLSINQPAFFTSPATIQYRNPWLNESQQDAVRAIMDNDQLTIIHGPPGTGKTTTLAEGIIQLISRGEKILVSAPSNAAVDHITKQLIRIGVKVLRVGNASKVDESVFAHTPEGRLTNSKEQKEIKQLKIRAEEFRRMALKYKRSFGKAEKEQKALLFKEVKTIRSDIKKLQAYNEEKLFAEAEVIAGTPVGLYDARLNKFEFHTLVIDEAGQCIEPLAWCIFPLASKIVLAGDHFQLPPTVISSEAAIKGFNISILELATKKDFPVILLNTQYRMREAIAGFSSDYFYNNLLQTAGNLSNTGIHITFIDTAGSGFHESEGRDGSSLQNEGELKIVMQMIERESIDPFKTAFISPYSGQVSAAGELLPHGMRISTIDSFQGQEKENIILSLVRSNEEGDIGFLKDYRRMNVAMTRAKEQLIVIGDSATIGMDPFYDAFISYVEKKGLYKSVWEYEI